MSIMLEEKNNIFNIQETLSKKNNGKIMFITQKSAKEEPTYKKLFKTNKEEYISTEDSPKKEILLKRKDNSDKTRPTFEVNIEKIFPTEVENKNLDSNKLNNSIKKMDCFYKRETRNKEEKTINSQEETKKKKEKNNSYKSDKKKDEEDFRTINNIINKHKYIKRNIYKLKRKKLGLPWQKIKNKKRSRNKTKSRSKSINNKEESIIKKYLMLDCILIENNFQIENIFKENKEKNNKFLNKKIKNDEKNDFDIIKDTKKANLKTTIKNKDIKEFKKDLIKENKNNMNNEDEEKLKGKEIEKNKEKIDKENTDKEKINKNEEIKLTEKQNMLKNLINEIIKDQVKQKENILKRNENKIIIEDKEENINDKIIGNEKKENQEKKLIQNHHLKKK